MTTPNNQPTPPEGMRLLTPEEYKNRLPEDSVYSPDGENWYKSGNIGKRPCIQHIYAIPITPTVPATGATTNEKGGKKKSYKLAKLHPIGTEHPASCAFWITCSPHEWTWKQSEQEEMARTIVKAAESANKVAELLMKIITAPARSLHIERQARSALEELGFDTDILLAAKKSIEGYEAEPPEKNIHE